MRAPFAWGGHEFTKGQLVLLDVHGIDHDEREWAQPDEFQPDRFQNKRITAFNFIPQGGGNHALNHRCAGEWLTIEALKTSALFLATAMTYKVPPQDLCIDLTRMPTRPASGFIMRWVRAAEPGQPALSQPVASAAPAAGTSGCPFYQG